MRESTFVNFLYFSFYLGKCCNLTGNEGVFRSLKKANSYGSEFKEGQKCKESTLMPGPEVSSIGGAPTLKLHGVPEGKRPCWLCRPGESASLNGLPPDTGTDCILLCPVRYNIVLSNAIPQSSSTHY